MKRYVVNENCTLKAFTDAACAPASFVFRALLKAREIRINGQKVSADLPLRAGDEVCYYLTPAQEAHAGFSVVYEDDNVVVVDKESGVNAEAVFSALREGGESYFLHRLDRNTAGLMIFARTPAAEGELLRCFRERRTEKRYLAQVAGKMPKRREICEAYLKKDGARALVRVSLRPIGDKIVTEYEVLAEEGETSLLLVTLHTGKTHQIRAHLAFLGHPVAGDEKYGDHAFNRAHNLTRQRLVAKRLRVCPRGQLAYLGGKLFESRFELLPL